MSAFGGLILLISGILFLTVLMRGQMAPASEAGAYRFAVPLHMPARIPVALNSFGLWLALMIGLTVVNYGYPIAQLMALKETSVPAVYVGASAMSEHSRCSRCAIPGSARASASPRRLRCSRRSPA